MDGFRGAIVRRIVGTLHYCYGRSWVDLKAIARGLGVSPRTTRRDLEILEQYFPMPKWRQSDAKEWEA